MKYIIFRAITLGSNKKMLGRYRFLCIEIEYTIRGNKYKRLPTPKI